MTVSEGEVLFPKTTLREPKEWAGEGANISLQCSCTGIVLMLPSDCDT